MDAVHPDLLNARRLPRYFLKRKKMRPFSLEPAGEPSRMITPRVLRELKRLGEPTPA
jgi:hypothetical protein